MRRLRAVCRLCSLEMLRIHLDYRDGRAQKGAREVYRCSPCNRTVEPPVKCKSCGAIIVWLQHATTGKAAPIDVYPNPGGNVVRVGETGYRVLLAGEARPTDAQLYANHFQTCPHAARHKTRSDPHKTR